MSKRCVENSNPFPIVRREILAEQSLPLLPENFNVAPDSMLPDSTHSVMALAYRHLKVGICACFLIPTYAQALPRFPFHKIKKWNVSWHFISSISVCFPSCRKAYNLSLQACLSSSTDQRPRGQSYRHMPLLSVQVPRRTRLHPSHLRHMLSTIRPGLLASSIACSVSGHGSSLARPHRRLTLLTDRILGPIHLHQAQHPTRSSQSTFWQDLPACRCAPMKFSLSSASNAL